MVMVYQAVLDEIVTQLEGVEPQGAVASYIPELTRVQPDAFAIALAEVDGTLHRVGDADQRFSVQSIAKVFILALAMSRCPSAIWKRVGVEPSGDPFNSLALLEFENGIPRNPLVNPGAMVICDILLEELDDPLAELLELVRSLAGSTDIVVDGQVASSELETGHKNRALANLMRSFGNIHNEVDRVLELYVQVCSIAMTATELANAFRFLADRGESLPPESKLSLARIRRINAIMLTCGFYDEAGEFAFSVGLPGKSGVGGGIAAVCPGRFAVATWSPRLTKGGNSYLGTRALEMLTTLSDSSIF